MEGRGEPKNPAKNNRSKIRTNKKFKMLSPGARFSIAPKTFRAWEAIFNCLYIENKEVYRHETLHEGKLCAY